MVSVPTGGIPNFVVGSTPHDESWTYAKSDPQMLSSVGLESIRAAL